MLSVASAIGLIFQFGILLIALLVYIDKKITA
ncbi:putative holin-like toxin [Leuconostoc pseudomesenteroides]